MGNAYKFTLKLRPAHYHTQVQHRPPFPLHLRPLLVKSFGGLLDGDKKQENSPISPLCSLHHVKNVYILVYEYVVPLCHSSLLLSSSYACTNRDKSQSGKTFAHIEYQDLSLTASWDALYNFCSNCTLYTLVWTKFHSIGLSWPLHVRHTHDSTLKICWHCEKGQNLCVALLSSNDDVTFFVHPALWDTTKLYCQQITWREGKKAFHGFYESVPWRRNWSKLSKLRRQEVFYFLWSS